MSRTYSARWCYVCGQSISAAGAAWSSHCRKHVREGKMIEREVHDCGFDYHLEFDIMSGIEIIAPPKRRTP